MRMVTTQSTAKWSNQFPLTYSEVNLGRDLRAVEKRHKMSQRSTVQEISRVLNCYGGFQTVRKGDNLGQSVDKLHFNAI